MKNIPLRTCIITHEKLPKKDLVRVVKNKDGIVNIDLTMKADGRGAYLKKDAEVFKTAQKKKALDYQLGVKVPDEIYEELNKLL